LGASSSRAWAPAPHYGAMWVLFTNAALKARKMSYESGSFDFLAAYVVLEDAWYILPAGKVAGRETVCLFSKSKYARYEDYQEAWQLLREASEIRDAESGVEEVSVAEPARVEPSSRWDGWRRPRNSLCVLWNGRM
jgi:hypothetical protein